MLLCGDSRLKWKPTLQATDLLPLNRWMEMFLKLALWFTKARVPMARWDHHFLPFEPGKDRHQEPSMAFTQLRGCRVGFGQQK